MANHTFTPNLENANKCLICQHVESAHGQCECCDNTDFIVKFKTMMMCQDCYHREINLTHQSNELADARVMDMNATIALSKEIDSAVTVRTDLFNAATVSIIDLKNAIDNDPTIENKPYVLAETLKERFNHYKQVVFEKTQEIVEAGNNQKAIQIYLNELANKLRADEREKLKIADINYKPNPVKVPTVKSIKTSSPVKRNSKEDKDLLAKLSKELGVADFTIKMVAVSKGITIEQAGDQIRRTLAESKSMGKV